MVVQYMIRDYGHENQVFCRRGQHWVVKDVEVFKDTRNRTGYNTMCKACGKQSRWESQRQYTLRLRAWLDSLKDRPCEKCGLMWPPAVLDWHHRDPATKLFNLSSAHRIKNKVLILAEVAKCDLYCSNCHRILTHTDETN